jgi:hypothetical protein
MQESFWGLSAVNSVYPSKTFLAEAKSALNAHELFEVSILGGWRGKVLAKEVGLWPARADGKKASGSAWKPPSTTCSLLMAPLLAIHYAALSAEYELHAKVNGNAVVLTYLPL